MPWVPIEQSGLALNFDDYGNSRVRFTDSRAICSDEDWFTPSWGLGISGDIPDGGLPVRVTAISYTQLNMGTSRGVIEFPGVGEFENAGAPGWAPSPMEVVIPGGADSILYRASVFEVQQADQYEFLIEALVDGPEPPVPSEPCEELGRVTRNYVSAYDRGRVHVARLYANERRCLVTNFNGAIPAGRTIARAIWHTQDAGWCVMSEPAVTGREVKVMIHAKNAGRTRIRVDAVLDNGEIYSAWHSVQVLSAPYVEYVPWLPGPTRLEALA